MVTDKMVEAADDAFAYDMIDADEDSEFYHETRREAIRDALEAAERAAWRSDAPSPGGLLAVIELWDGCVSPAILGNDGEWHTACGQHHPTTNCKQWRPIPWPPEDV